jgi:hypothetical protein
VTIEKNEKTEKTGVVTREDRLASPSEAVMEFLRRNHEALLMAADCAVRADPESTVQRVVLMLDMSDERSRRIAQIGVDVGKVPPLAVSDAAEAMILVVTIDAARSLVEEVSRIPIDRFDSAAQYSSATRGMMLVVLTCESTFVGCLPRADAEIARA